MKNGTIMYQNKFGFDVHSLRWVKTKLNRKENIYYEKILAGILAVSMIGSANLAFATDTDKITVKVNGEEIITDVAPVMENDKIFLPRLQVSLTKNVIMWNSMSQTTP